MNFKKIWVLVQLKFSKFFVNNFFWIVFISFFIICGVGGYLFVIPKYKLYDYQNKSEIPELKNKLDDLKKQIEQIENDNLDFDKIKNNQELQKLLKILPTKQKIADIFIEFDAMAKNENFKIVNMSITEDFSENSPKQNKKNLPKNIKKITIQTSLAGSGYESLKRLIKMLETNLRVMDIQSLSFIPNFNGATLYSFMITTYYTED